MQERRAYYRLQYPVMARPMVSIGTRSYSVVDISERSARLVFNEGLPERPNTKVNGKIRFDDGEELDIEGATLRRVEDGLVIVLSKGISFRRMVVEQVRLRERFPRYFQREEEDGITDDDVNRLRLH